MPTDDTHPISAEAHERVKQDNADLKAKLAEADLALHEVALRDRMSAHFAQILGMEKPHEYAAAAIRDVTLKGVAQEELPQRLDAWLAEQRSLFVPPAPAVPAETATPPPPSPFQGPNPGAPGYAAKVEPMVLGSQRWKEWAKGKSAQEQLDARRRGDAVPSDKVKRAQGTVGSGAP